MKPRWTWKNVQLPRKALEQWGREFEKGLLEQHLSGTEWMSAGSYEIELLAYLGDVYSRLGHVQQGLEVDKTLVSVRPHEPKYLYNLACSYSQLGHIESAFEALETAVRKGYEDFDHLRNDRDLDNLKKDARFHKLLEQFDTSV